MKSIEVRLNLEVVAPLLDLIKAAADGLKEELAITAVVPDSDADFADGWRQELLQDQTGDIQVLLRVFGREFFANGIIALDASNSEAVLRACSAVRLRLKSGLLQRMEDEVLESGEVPVQKLTEDEHKAFACYVFLATLQELIIEHLDPSGRGV
ncbi:MAG: hypothetical protein PHQ04_08545 [Opitutaceae bacterium]|nr:hypothetical protein [Opitutaceae bacterium]